MKHRLTIPADYPIVQSTPRIYNFVHGIKAILNVHPNAFIDVNRSCATAAR